VNVANFTGFAGHSLVLAALTILLAGAPTLASGGSLGPEIAPELAPEPPQQESVLRPVMVQTQVLSIGDVERYRRIFTHQRVANWKAADQVMEGLENRILVGHVLALRYLHPTHYQTRYAELAAWLRSYSDHPDADEVYKLASKRKPRGAGPPGVAPKDATPRYFEEDTVPIVTYQSARRRDTRTRREVGGILRSMRRHSENGRLTRAEELFRQKRTEKLLDEVEINIARFHLGSGHFYMGNPETAYGYLAAAANSSKHLPFAQWMAGLAAFRIERFDAAADHFEAAASSGHFDPWDLAAAGFWAGRANLLAGRPEKVGRWLTLAAEQPHTFYGLLATRLLGMSPPFDWSMPTVTDASLEAIRRSPAGERALALFQIGEARRAERELRTVLNTRNAEVGRAVVALAEAQNLPALALNAGAMLINVDGAAVHAALYPIPPWAPERGFVVDRALVYAFMRQESRFKVNATSRVGARGLMQLMPATAGFVAKRRFRGSSRSDLYDPELNIALGQKYIVHLLNHDLVEGDVLRAAAAYNGGPGNLNKWLKQATRTKVRDPLMFIELIPARETRVFVERVVSNLWIYQMRLGQETPTLDALAAGERPIYKSLDVAARPVANDVRH
jgi:soluble lytic murein transglycosylase-like protein